MQKIGFLKIATLFIFAAIAGSLFSLSILFLSEYKQDISSKTEIPFVDYEKIDNYKGGTIMSNSPFKLSAPDMNIFPNAPVPPGIPDMPNDYNNDKVVLLGVLPPDVCIIKKGHEVITAHSGEKTFIGVVTNITSQGIYLDGKFLKMN